MSQPDSTPDGWPAPAKLNLFLHVLGRRADGYHRLQTLFQFLDYGDELRFELRRDGRIHRPVGDPAVPEDQDLSVRAARLLQSASACGQGVDIHLHKRTPIAAGLGGGSSDAATTLVVLNRLWGCGLSMDALASLGLQLGADVPVFVRGQAAWGEGIGEQLQAVEPPEAWYAVLAPDVRVSTAEIFAAADLPRDHPPIGWQDYLAGAGGNDCTAVTCARYPAVAAALRWLETSAPARMSGTGAAVFAAFQSREAATAAIINAPAAWHRFVARGLNRSPLAAALALRRR